MSELYWITRLDAINAILIVLTVLGVFGLIAYIATYICIKMSPINELSSSYEVNCYRQNLAGNRISRWFVVGLIIGVLGCIFVPTTKQGLIIYGVGGTIDYIKGNETAKKLPDKVVEALDKYLDELNGGEEKK